MHETKSLNRNRTLFPLCLSILALTTASCASSAPAPPPVPEARLTFWARVDVTPPIGAVAGQNACGPTLSVAGMRVPRDPSIEPAQVNQIDEDADILRSWSVPINLIPVAVDGDSILLRKADAEGALLQVSADGSARERSLPQLARPEAGACPPRPIEQYAADALCVSVVDIATRQKLLLEFEEPCS